MFIVLHCGGMPFKGDTIATKSLGGSETACYYMAKELAQRGHRVVVFTTIDVKEESPDKVDGVKYLSMGTPTEQAPLGDRFHAYACNTPHDVLIIQRHPLAFRFPWACRIGLWWLHDLALGRLKNDVIQQFWNMDGILTVSEWHKQQVVDVWGIDPDRVYPIQNGIDLSLFDRAREPKWPEAFVEPTEEQFKLLYAARPERGLENLLMPGGIMDKLKDKLPNAHLYYCTYDNVAEHMVPFYNRLDAWAAALPNVTKLAPMTKQQLADVERQCDLYAYPTSFEDTSCIMMMECAAAGLPVLTSNVAALPETTRDGGRLLIDLKPDGTVDIDAFVDSVVTIHNDNHRARDNDGHSSLGQSLRNRQGEIAGRFDWMYAAEMLLKHVRTIRSNVANNTNVLRGLINDSDYYAALQLVSDLPDDYDFTGPLDGNPIIERCKDELVECYGFAADNTWSDHYAKYYEYEAKRGVNYGPESLEGNLRYMHVANLVGANTGAGDVVIDYGCAHGHYTVNLAKRFPDRRFVGIDLAQSNIEKARKWAADENVTNVRFYRVGDNGVEASEQRKSALINAAKIVIAAEVLEHVASPGGLAHKLATDWLRDDGMMIMTTPIGPWEAQGYREHHPWRAHVHHLTWDDLKDLFGAWPNFNTVIAPSGHSNTVEPLGSYITTTGKPTTPPGAIDYLRKIEDYVPRRQTVSLCMIVHNAQDTLRRCLDSAAPYVDEVVIAVDKNTNDRTREVIEQFRQDQPLWPVVVTLEIDSPLEIGFGAARNLSIARASGDWVLWLDDDEILVHGENLPKYLRNNMFQGYAMKQHHFTVDPLGVQKTDLPCRLFRNYRGVQFFGVVHEHPEKEMNKGVGNSMLIPDIDIAHTGYTTEAIRQGRFQRNLGLLVKDREQNPNRLLGKFLWIRDLAQMCAWEANMSGQRSPQMIARARQGIAMFEELLHNEEAPPAMLREATEFYTVLVSVVDPQALEVAFTIDASKLNGGVHPEEPRTARFASVEHATQLINRTLKEKVKPYESKYW